MADKIALSLEIETGKAVKNLGQLESATKKLNKTVDTADKETKTLQQQFDGLNKEIKESPVNIRAMNKQIQAYQAIALEAGRTTPLGKQAIQQAAALKDRYIDIQNEVNRLANDGVKLQAALDIGTTVVGGFAAFQGVMALSGVKSEELRETMVKLQAAQSILMGVETIRKNLEKESTIVLVAKNTAEKANLILTKATTVATRALGLSTDTTTKSFKLMRAALIATGIGALIVGIGLLIANWDKLTAALGASTKEQLAYNEATEKAIESAGEELNALDMLQDVLNDETISRDDKNKAVAELQKEYPDLLANIDAEVTSLEDLKKILEQTTELTLLKAQADALAEMRTESFKKETQERINMQNGENAGLWEHFEALSMNVALMTTAVDVTMVANSKSKDRIAIQKEQQDVVTGLRNDIKAKMDAIKGEMAVSSEASIKAQQEAEIQKKWDEQEKEREKEKTKTLKEQKRARDKIKETAKRQEEKAQADAVRQAEADRVKEENRIIKLNQTEATAKATLIDTLIKLENEYEDSQLSKEQQELNRVRDKFNVIIEGAKLHGQDVTTLMKAQASAEKDITDKHQKDREDSEKATNEKIAADRQQVSDGFVNTSLQVIDTLMKINSENAGDTEREQKKAFETNKKLQIAQTLISTYGSAVSSFQAMSGIPYVGPILGAIAAAAAIVSGMAQISAIKKQKFDSPSEGGAGVQTPNLSMGDGAPTIDPVTNTSTVIPTGDLEPQKVFVTETDISATQNKVEVIEAQATI